MMSFSCQSDTDSRGAVTMPARNTVMLELKDTESSLSDSTGDGFSVFVGGSFGSVVITAFLETDCLIIETSSSATSDKVGNFVWATT